MVAKAAIPQVQAQGFWAGKRLFDGDHSSIGSPRDWPVISLE
jgi:hypothetical protein